MGTWQQWLEKQEQGYWLKGVGNFAGWNYPSCEEIPE